jgi:AraC-like DNA-binding protein
MNHPTLPIVQVRDAIAGAVAQNIDYVPLLEECGISPSLLHADNGRVSLEAFVKLDRALSAIMNDEYLGLCHRPQRPGSSRIHGKLALQAQCLGEALELTADFHNLFENSLRHEVFSEKKKLTYTVERRPGLQLVHDYAIELILCSIHRFHSWLAGERIVVDTVYFDYDWRKEKKDEYENMFFCPNVHFNECYSSFTFSASYYQQPIRPRSTDLESWVRRSKIELFLPRLTLGKTTLEVRELIGKAILEGAENIKQTTIAEEMGIKSHTLSRRLAAEGTSYQETREHLLRDTAMQMLSNTTNSIESISNALLYSEPAAFTRAFKKWTGMTPLGYRIMITR